MEKSKEFQCIVISLKDALFDKADALVGVARDQAEQSSVTYTVDLTPYPFVDKKAGRSLRVPMPSPNITPIKQPDQE